MTKLRVYGALLVILGLLAACNSQPKTEAQTVTDPEVGVHSVHTGADHKVEVKLTEFKMEMSTTVAAGPTTFTVTNAGSDVHSFEVEGNGMEKRLATHLQAGQTKTLQVDLKPGTYKVYCPVDGHKMIGMSLNLTVSQAGRTWPAPTQEVAEVRESGDHTVRISIDRVGTLG